MPTLVTAAGNSIATAAWTVVALMVTTGGAVVLAIIKQWGPWQRGASDGRDADFARLRNDITDLKEANVDVAARLTAAELTIAWQTVRLGQQDFVIKLMTDELEVVSPGNAVARQVRTLLDRVHAGVAVPPVNITPAADDREAIRTTMERLHSVGRTGQ